MSLHYGQFLPPNISDCTAWFDAADANSITLNGTDVAQWNDKSGNDNHIAQGTAAYQPAYQATGWSGADPTIYFNGGNDYLRAITIGRNVIDTGDMTVIVAINRTAGGSAYLFSQYATGETLPTNNLFSTQLIDPNHEIVWEFGAGTNEIVDTLVTGSVNNAVYYFNRNTTALTVDFISIDAGATVTALNLAYANQAAGGTDTYFMMGGLYTAWNIDASISEFIVYKRVLTEGERLLVTNYLRNKWGI